jgi:hypothetical protein
MALLQQFQNHQVRADFINGKFDRPMSSNLLSALDEVRWSLFPRWRGRDNIEGEMLRCDSAVGHCKKLFAKHRSPFKLSISNHDIGKMTYEAWYEVIHEISADSYWKRVAPEERCTHTVKEEYTKSTLNAIMGQVSSNSRKLVKRERRVIEEIVISSSSGESQSEASDDESSDKESTSDSGRRSRYRKYTRKEVVTPPIFKVNGKMPLADFFPAFEKYFHKKFDGGEYDQSQELGSFLEGKLLEVYEAQGGRLLKYTKLKNQLLTWYKKQKIGTGTYWRQQMKIMKPEIGESLDIYGMRLIEISKMAYPKSKTECARHLRERFLDSIDPAITRKIIDAERTVRAASHSKSKYMAFSDLLQMAQDLQQQMNAEKQVMWSGGTTAAVYTSHAVNSELPVRVQDSERSPSIGRRKSYSGTLRASDMICHFCKLPGHIRRDCWRANNACLICGQDHRMVDCPKYDPKRKPVSTTHLNYQASVTEGNH